MLRSIAVIVSVLVAMSAQAQDASTPEGEEKPAPNAPAPAAEGEESQAVVASIEPAGSQRPLLPQPAPAARSDAGIEAELPREQPTDCGMQDSMLGDQDPSVAVRSRQPEITDRPEVWRVGRCFRKAILQVKSKSKEPWVIKSARVEGPGGEVLKVTGIRPRLVAPDMTISVIVAERTDGAALTSKMKLTLHLVAEDGRVALLEEALP